MRSVILSDCVVNLGLPVTCVQLGVLVVVLNKQVLNPTLPESEKKHRFIPTFNGRQNIFKSVDGL